jgi:hypothetical protein
MATQLVSQAQEGMSFARAATFLPVRNGKRTHASTLMRWANDGVRGPSGDRIRLETLRVGGRRLVTMAALNRFLTRLNADVVADEATADDAARRAKQSGKALEALGC